MRRWPRVDDPHHEGLLLRVGGEAAKLGYLTPSVDLTCHAGGGDPEFFDALKTMHCYPALAVRCRKDRLALCPRLGIAFSHDAKTNQTGSDVIIEAYPWAAAVADSRRGGEALFCVEIGGYFSFGVWANDDNARLVQTVFLPDRWDRASLEDFATTWGDAFPDARVKVSQWEFGSGDPLVRIPFNVARDHLPNWQSCLKARQLGPPSRGLRIAGWIYGKSPQ